MNNTQISHEQIALNALKSFENSPALQKMRARYPDLQDFKIPQNESELAQFFYKMRGTAPADQNEFLTELTNKVVGQITFDLVGFENPFDIFIKPAFLMGDQFEFFGLNYLEPKDWDGASDTTIPSKSTPQTLRAEISTQYRKYVQSDITEDIIAGAFTSPARLNNFVALYIGKLMESYKFWRFQTMPADIQKGIVNTTEIDKPTATDPASIAKSLWVNIYKIGKTMTYPSKDFNIGYVKGDTKNTLAYTAIPMKDLVLIISPEIWANLLVEIKASLFKSELIDPNEWFGTVIVWPQLPTTDLCWIIGKEAYQYIPRFEMSANGFLPWSLRSMTFYHWWVRTGVIPFQAGTKFIYKTTPPPKY